MLGSIIIQRNANLKKNFRESLCTWKPRKYEGIFWWQKNYYFYIMFIVGQSYLHIFPSLIYKDHEIF